MILGPEFDLQTCIEITRLHTKKTNNLIYKWPKRLSKTFSKEDIQRAQRHVKRCSASIVITGIQSKITMRYHFTLVRMAIMNKSINNKAGNDVKQSTH